MRYRAAIIGGGFYGCFLATYLARRLGRVVVLEREPELLTRASYVNQARLHNGTHYPRSFRTAASSRKNMVVFQRMFEESIDTSFRALYCIARSGSKVSRKHYERFCRTLRIPLREAPPKLQQLFNPRWIDAVYETEEYAFDADQLRATLESRMADADVEVRIAADVRAVEAGDGDTLRLALADGEEVAADWVFNCTYASLNQLAGTSREGAPRLKHQVTEVALVEPPPELAALGVTVMDGAFFSTMPFPARKLHSFTHVRYTPHHTWIEEEHPELDPLEVLALHAKQTNFPRMVRDAQRYMPIARGCRFVEALFEIKTVLMQTDVDDARPIAFHRDARLPRFVSILGGKLDNIFDVIEVLDREQELT